MLPLRTKRAYIGFNGLGSRKENGEWLYFKRKKNEKEY
jgi:hypothetical protein